MLTLEHVSKTFNPGTVNEKKALDGLDLHLEKGRVRYHRGFQRSRKIHAVQCGCRQLLRGRGGIFLWEGRDITFLPEYKRSRSIGRLFQDPLRGTAPPHDH